MQAEQVAHQAGSDSSLMPQVNNTVDVTPYLRNPFLRDLQKRNPESFGRFLVRTMDDAGIAREMERIDRRMARLRAVGRKFREFYGPLTKNQRSRFARLTQEYVQAKTQRQAILAEQEHRQAQQETLSARRQESAADRARRIEQLRKDLWQESGLGESNCTFDTLDYDQDYPDRCKVIERAIAWADQYPNVSKGIGLFGFTGVGKTCIAKCIAWALNQRPEPVSSIFIKCSQLGSLLEAEKQEKPKQTLMARAKQANLVIIDDLDKALGGLASFEAQRWIRELLDWLDDNKRIAITTSEFPLTPDPRYADADGNLVCFANCVKPYIYGRVVALFDWAELTGRNYRLLNNDHAENWWA